MPFVKLDCGILNSTLWFDRQARDVFITALLMAEPFELLEPTPQIEVKSLDPTGWIVPPGWYGFVPAAGVGIIHRAGIEENAGQEALTVLGSPESSSRSPDFEGRRLVRIDGGYLVLNFIKYREKDASGAERQRRWRERQKVRPSASALPVTVSTSRVISNQAEAEAEAEVRTAPEAQAREKGFDAFWQSWPEGHRVNQKQAIGQWRKTPETDRTLAIAEVQWRVAHDVDWQGPRPDGKWAIPHPFRYLRDRRFTDARGDAKPPAPANRWHQLREPAPHPDGRLIPHGSGLRCPHNPVCETDLDCVRLREAADPPNPETST